MGTKNQSSMGTILEHKSRSTLIVHLCDDRPAAAVADGVVKTLRRPPEHMRISLTSDRGMKIADHADTSTALGMPVLFCDPRGLGDAARMRTPTALGSGPRKLDSVRGHYAMAAVRARCSS